MTIINANTKRGQVMLERAAHWDGEYLYQVYDRWSAAKEAAYDRCRQMCYEEGGKAFSIISHNTFGFSVSWVTDEGVRIETPKNSYFIPC